MKLIIKFSFVTLLLLSLHVNAQELVVVVSNVNTINMLSKRQVIDIYMGRYMTFPDGKNAQPLDLDSPSELKNDFYFKLVNQSERRINAYWARVLFSGRSKPPKSVQSINEVLTLMKNSESAIAYIPESQVNHNVKVVYRLNEN